MANARMEKLFATPLLVSKVTDPDLNAQLEAVILKRREEHPGVKRSNRGAGWHSDLQLLQWGGEAALRLRNTIITIANEHTVDVAGKPTVEWGVEAWANVNERDGANMRHVHGGCYWSAVYYVRVDEGEAGSLVLHDLRMPTLAMHAPYLRFRDVGSERDVRIKPEAGLLIMFPSWLPHEVEPSASDGLRISIAINLTAVRRPPRGSLKQDASPAKAAAVTSQPKKDDQ